MFTWCYSWSCDELCPGLPHFMLPFQFYIKQGRLGNKASCKIGHQSLKLDFMGFISNNVQYTWPEQAVGQVGFWLNHCFRPNLHMYTLNYVESKTLYVVTSHVITKKLPMATLHPNQLCCLFWFTHNIKLTAFFSQIYATHGPSKLHSTCLSNINS